MIPLSKASPSQLHGNFRSCLVKLKFSCFCSFLCSSYKRVIRKIGSRCHLTHQTSDCLAASKMKEKQKTRIGNFRQSSSKTCGKVAQVDKFWAKIFSLGNFLGPKFFRKIYCHFLTYYCPPK